MNFNQLVTKFMLVVTGIILGWFLFDIIFINSVYPVISENRNFINTKRFADPKEIPRETIYRSSIRGALGSHYRNQKNFCIMIGGSTLATHEVHRDFSFQQFVEKMTDQIHLENFSYAGHTWSSFELIVKEAISFDRRINCVILSSRLLHFSFEKNKFPFHFSKQWYFFLEKHNFQLWLFDFIKNRLAERSGRTLLRPLFEPLKARMDKILFYNPIQKLGNPFKYRESTVDWSEERPQLNEVRIQKMREYFERTIELAKNYNLKLILLSHNNAYDELEVPGVAQKWSDLYFDKSNRLLPNSYLARRDRLSDQFISEWSKQDNIPFINLDDWGRELVRVSNDYYIDRWHFSEKGMTLIGPKFVDSLAKALEVHQ